MTLARAIKVFDARHPALRSALRADGACVYAAERFRRFLPGAACLHLWGSRRYFPDRIDEYPAKDPGYYHVVNVYGQMVIDWTRRPLDPYCEHPFIQPLWQLRREWRVIRPTWKQLEELM